MATLADVVRRWGPEYLECFGERIPASHRRALRDIAACRTAALGGQLTRCNQCGQEQYVYHSCRNRSCPTCHGDETRQWVAARRLDLLPVTYFHLVFTVPQELRGVIRAHQRLLLSALATAAAHALLRLAADPRYALGTIGILAVLHTWTRDLVYHPHVHCLVPGGAHIPDGRHWIAARPGFLVPVRALSVLFRAEFMALARKALPDAQFPESVWHTPWVVYCKPAVQGASKVLDYLGRYVHRIAITDSRILSTENGTVTFRFKDAEAGRWRTTTLRASEFLRRFLQHVLPRGFHKVRYYGLLSPSYRPRLRQIQLLLTTSESASKVPSAAALESAPAQGVYRCPHCDTGILIVIAHFAPCVRSPP